MRMAALMEVMREDKALKSVYLIGQDYSFGQAVLREAKNSWPRSAPMWRWWATSCTLVGAWKDFAPYAVKIKSSGARRRWSTGNWGNDLTLLVKAAREVGYEGSFYTFYGNALGAPPPWVMRALARWWPWPTGCQCAGCAERGVLPVLPRTLSQAAGRLCCTCACSS